MEDRWQKTDVDLWEPPGRMYDDAELLILQQWGGLRTTYRKWVFGRISEKEFVSERLAKCKKNCQVCAQGHEGFVG